jgi:hypothetical protein
MGNVQVQTDDLMFSPSRVVRLAVAVFIVLSAARIYTKRPESDEAVYAASAVNLLEKGHTGIPIAHPLGNGVLVDRPLPGIDQHFYGWMPTHQAFMAAWYALFGFNVFTMRANAVLWGLLALLAWWRVFRFLTADETTASLAALFIGTDYMFVSAASGGRMDMMCAALWAMALAAYVELRETRLGVAILLSQTLVALSGMTHPIGALGFLCLAALTLALDRRRLRLFHIGLAALPYVAGALAVAAYILPDLGGFWAQFSAVMSTRTRGSHTIWGLLTGEITRRYAEAYFPTYARHGASALRVLVPLAFACGIVFLVATPGFRKAYRLLLLLAAVAAIGLCVIDNGKMPYYLVHVTPLYCAMLAVAFVFCFRTGQWIRGLAVTLCALFLFLQVGWTLGTVARDPYHKSFLPMANFLHAQLKPESTVTASPELGFTLGFDPKRFRDDALLGYASGREADYIVVGQSAYGTIFADYRKYRPQLAEYVDRLLRERYEEIYHSDFYEIYRRRLVRGGSPATQPPV